MESSRELQFTSFSSRDVDFSKSKQRKSEEETKRQAAKPTDGISRERRQHGQPPIIHAPTMQVNSSDGRFVDEENDSVRCIEL